MNTKKHSSTDKLQKSSMLFLQLGLVLALFFVYTALEFETVQKMYTPPEVASTEPSPSLVPDQFFTIERKVVVKERKKVSPNTFTKAPDKAPIFSDVPAPIDTDDAPNIKTMINHITEAPTTIEDPEDIPFPILEDAPIFPGCEGLEKAASKKCFTEQITKFVNRKFDTSLAEGLNLQGKQKIWVQFKIDKTGTIVDISARAPHKSLEKEAIRIIEKLPHMTPGMQRKNPVGVKYTLPILFEVH